MSLDNDVLNLIRSVSEPLPPIAPGLRINVPQNRAHYHARVIPQSERHCTNCAFCSNCWQANTNPIFPLRWDLRNEWDHVDVIPYLKGVYAGLCGNFTNINPRIGIAPNVSQNEWEA